MPEGTIKKLMSDRGFGFIQRDRGDIFFHHSALQGTTIEALQVGQHVEYEEGSGPERASCRECETRLAAGQADHTYAPHR
jgi:CspA family cold shock protein